MSTYLVTTPTTELQAINTMLESIGEAPVSDLSDTGLGDVAVAKNFLGRSLREVLSKGWDFNTDYQYPMALDGDSKIPVASNVLEIDPDGNYAHMDVVVRGGFLWDRYNKRYTFDSAITCHIVWLFEFASLPEAARRYITVLAARRFAKSVLGEDAATRMSVEDEETAWALLMNHECRVGAHNMLNASYSVANILERGAHSGYTVFDW